MIRWLKNGHFRRLVVAVKKLPGHNITPNILSDFLKEMRLMKSLRHPNILMFMGASLSENHKDLAIIMEYMPRNSLWTGIVLTRVDVRNC